MTAIPLFEMIADLPLAERPRERMKKHGARTLSDSELVAILLGSGKPGKNAISLAREMLAGGLTALGSTEPGQLAKVSGVGAAKASRIVAAFEIGRRLAAGEPDDRADYDPDIIAMNLMMRCSEWRQEHLCAVFLDSRERILGERQIYVGTIDRACVSTRDVLKFSLEADAVGVVLYHNHPSGDPTPSPEDLTFTTKMAAAFESASLNFIDHLIIGKNRYLSMKGKELF